MSLSSIALVASLVAILGGGGVIGWWRSTKPSRERSAAVADAILGKAPVFDRAGGILEDKQLGLVDRTTTLEKAVALIANQDARIKAVEVHQIAADARFDGLEQTVGLLIGTKYKDGADALLAAVELQQKNTIDADSD